MKYYKTSSVANVCSSKMMRGRIPHVWKPSCHKLQDPALQKTVQTWNWSLFFLPNIALADVLYLVSTLAEIYSVNCNRDHIYRSIHLMWWINANYSAVIYLHIRCRKLKSHWGLIAIYQCFQLRKVERMSQSSLSCTLVSIKFWRVLFIPHTPKKPYFIQIYSL